MKAQDSPTLAMRFEKDDLLKIEELAQIMGVGKTHAIRILVREGKRIANKKLASKHPQPRSTGRPTKRAPDACPVCLGSGVRVTKITGVQTKCRSCRGTGQRR